MGLSLLGSHIFSSASTAVQTGAAKSMQAAALQAKSEAQKETESAKAAYKGNLVASAKGFFAKLPLWLKILFLFFGVFLLYKLYLKLTGRNPGRKRRKGGKKAKKGRKRSKKAKKSKII
jgi:hypothetical protein